MKLLIHSARIITGLLFIFSGMVKLNDPAGFAIKLDEYFDVFAKDASTQQDSIGIAIYKDGRIESRRIFQLYKFDTDRELTVKSSTISNKDSFGIARSHEVTVVVSLRGDEVGTIRFTLPDSVSSAFFSVKAEVAAKVVFQSDFHANAAANIDFHKSIDLKNYVKSESALVGFFQGFKTYSLWLSILFCALEVILGFALIVGWNIRFTSWLMLLLILFFSFLTGYSYLSGYCPTKWLLYLSVFAILITLILGLVKNEQWRRRLGLGILAFAVISTLLCIFTGLCFSCAFNQAGMKVTDCGCFGDFLKLKPWESFYKDLILLLLILIVFFGAHIIKPWFSKRFGWKFISIVSLLSISFGVYCYLYLPVWDFLPYKNGNNILKVMTDVPKGMRASDSIQITFLLKKGNDSVRLGSDKMMPYMEKGYELVADSRKDKLIVEGYKNPIHDFAINDPKKGEDLKEKFLHATGYQLVWINTFVDKGYTGANPEISEIYNWSSAKKVDFYALSANSPEATEIYIKAHKLPFGFYLGDEKMLKTMARYNPTLYLFKGPVVIDKWSGRNLPSTKKLEKLMR